MQGIKVILLSGCLDPDIALVLAYLKPKRLKMIQKNKLLLIWVLL